MADSPTKGAQKPTFEASVIAGLYFLANKFITDTTIKNYANGVIPFAGGFLAYAARRGGQYLHYRQLLTIEEDFLKEAQQKRLIATDAKECARLEKEIVKRQAALEKLRKDNILF